VLHDDAVILVLEPLHSINLVHSVVDTNRTTGHLLLSNSSTRSGNLDIEIHTVNTCAWIVLDTKIDVLLDTETEVSALTEVSLLELVLLDLQSLLKDLLGLLASNGDMARDLVVSTDSERSDSVSGYG
jgi:hypothetical protein